MYKPDDKDIDRLSREAAEHYQVPGTPAWDALRQTLEKQLPQEKEKKRRGFLFFFLLFIGLSLTGSTIWYGIHTSSSGISPRKTAVDEQKELKEDIAVEPTGTKKNNTSEKADDKIDHGLPTGTLPADHSTVDTKNVKAGNPATAEIVPQHGGVKTTSKDNTTLGTTAAKNKKTVQDAENNIIPPANSIATNNKIKRTAPSITAAKQYPNANTVDYSTTAISSVNHKKFKGKPLQNNKKQAAENHKPLNTTQRDGNDVAETKNNDITLNNDSATVPATQDAVNAPQTPVKDSAIAKTAIPTKNMDSAKPAAAKAKAKSKNEKAILLGLTAGFDFSTVKFTYGSNAGYNFGFMGGYQFNKHWAALTGIIYTKKNYKLNGSDYHPPKHDWVQYVDLQKVDGFCRMWELPVLARYIFNPGAKNTFFATAGLSSYFMNKQQYDYYYKNYMGVPMTAPWHSDSTYNHVFSILDISAGLEKPIGKHMDLLIEPYAKIPLGGVGHGNIRLSSFGVNLTMQYKKPLKR